MMPGINNWGHGGGVIGGILLAMLLGYEEGKAENALHRVVAALCALATVGVLGWAVLSSLMIWFEK
jgi:rhomboid protease GluP